MLRQRILTAVVLLAGVVAALLAPTPWPFIVLLSAASGAALWEWLRLTASDAIASVLAGVAFFVFCLVQAWIWTTGASALALASMNLVISVIAPLVSALWLLVVFVLLVRAQVDAPARSPALSLFALLALFAAWSALAILFLSGGAWFVVSLLILVWVADSVAYFVGRKWGRRKLASAVSPGKSVEGALGGLVGGVLWIVLSGQFEGSYGHALIVHWGWLGAIPLAALLVAVSIIGDLFESLLKRRAGRKDSSQLLPGHGGVYDRIDAIVPVAPLALVLAWLAPGA